MFCRTEIVSDREAKTKKETRRDQNARGVKVTCWLMLILPERSRPSSCILNMNTVPCVDKILVANLGRPINKQTLNDMHAVI